MSVPKWKISGDWFDSCSCDIGCPCGFGQQPTKGFCEGVLAWHIKEGKYGDVVLDDLNAAAVLHAPGPGPPWETGNISMGLFIDERASPEQREALQKIFFGQAGGVPAMVAKLVTKPLGVKFVPIDFKYDGESWSVNIPGAVDVKSGAFRGPMTPPGQLVKVLNIPYSEGGPGHPVTIGQSTVGKIEAFGLKIDTSGLSSRHMEFEYSGP